jgi:membrane protein DedA with SNARE-associated domain
MPWRRFLAFNAAGGVVWAAIFGFGAYTLGEGFTHLQGRLAIAGIVLGVLGIVGGLWFVRRHEAALMREADRTLGSHSIAP